MPATGCVMSRTDPQIDPAVLEQSIQWLVKIRFDAPDAVTRQNFETWLAASPEHARAWSSVSDASQRFSNLPSDLSRRTLGGARSRMSRRQSLKMLGLFAGSGALLWAVRDHSPLPGLLADYRSGIGERRQVDLADGSRVRMNSSSAFDAELDGQQRLIRLLYGELLVESRAAARHALWVGGRDGYLRVQGARFLLRQHDEAGSLLVVQDGTVAVFSGQLRGEPAALVQAGESVLFDVAGVRQAPDDGLDPWGWSDGVISARDMPLGAFLAELSRHRHGVLRCNPDVAQLRVSGTYQLSDTNQVLNLLATSLPVRVDYRTDYWVTVSARS